MIIWDLILCSGSTKVGMKVSLLLLWDLGNDFHYTKQGGPLEYFLIHSTTSFISLYHNPASHFLRPEHTHPLFLPWIRELSLLSLHSSQAFLCLPHLPFLLSSTILHVAQIPSPWSGMKALQMGFVPHPFIKSWGGLPTYQLDCNSFLAQRIVLVLRN